MKLAGEIHVPGDKSISHRALILASLANGESSIRGILRSADIESTAVVLRSLGAMIPTLADDMVIHGRGLDGWNASTSALLCGNSGTTARLIAGGVAARPFISRFEGDSSLSRRPMHRISEPLTAMGARVEFDHDDGLPMTVHGGGLSGIVWSTNAASAQTKSAILLAGLVGGVHVTVRDAARSRDHTERMLMAMGGRVRTDGTTVSITPVGGLAPLDIDIPRDPSSAAYAAALGVLATSGEVRIPGVCLNPTRVGFLEALRRMGGSVRYVDRRTAGGEETGTVVTSPSSLRSARVGASDVHAMIDEIPLLACVAAAAGVNLDVVGARELRVKESDRIHTVVSNLLSIGAFAEELPDGLKVTGARVRLRGRVVTDGDHRIAMAFGVLAALSGNEIEIDDRDCVAVSYPSFWRDLESLVPGAAAAAGSTSSKSMRA
jgi:3-phosphoshikimate 1-carboxyvinyltransferase